MAIRATKMEKINNEAGGFSIVTEHLTRDFAIISLMRAQAGMLKDKREEVRIKAAEVGKAVDLLEKYVTRLDFKPIKNGGGFTLEFDITNPEGGNAEDIASKVRSAIEDELIVMILNFSIVDPIRKQFEPKEKKTHKQSRSYLRRGANIIGRDYSGPSLFSLNNFDELKQLAENDKTGDLNREALPSKAHILGMQLNKEWQYRDKDEDGFVTIRDIDTITSALNITVQELKMQCYLLGGFNYPDVIDIKDSNEVEVRFSRMYDIRFRYDRKHIDDAKTGKTENVNLRGLLLIKNAPISAIMVKPSELIINDLNKKKRGDVNSSLGYTNVSDDLIPEIQGVSDYALKLFSFSITQKPEYKIGEQKLLGHLGLDVQVKTQGRKRIIEKIFKAFEELKEKGHFSEYTLPDGHTTFFEWKYTNRFVKSKNKKEPAEGTKPSNSEYIDFDDPAHPVEKRRDAYSKWLIEKKGRSAQKAKELAEKKFKADH